LIASDEFAMVIIVETIGDLFFGQKTDSIHLLHSMQIYLILN
jgi:hypothetical protein